MLRCPAVAGGVDSCLAMDLGRGDCLHQDGEPDISPGRLQTILVSSYIGQQADRCPAIPDGADNVLVNDSDFHRCCYSHVRRRAGGASYQNGASFLTFLLTRTLRHILSLPANNKSARIVMGKNKLKIGEFSRLGRVTVRDPN